MLFAAPSLLINTGRLPATADQPAGLPSRALMVADGDQYTDPDLSFFACQTASQSLRRQAFSPADLQSLTLFWPRTAPPRISSALLLRLKS